MYNETEVKIMMCGHPANWHIEGTEEPCCRACAMHGISGWDIVNEGLSLAGRESRCYYCHVTVESSPDLNRFQYLRGSGMDLHVCMDCEVVPLNLN